MSGQAAFDKPVRPAALCRDETADTERVERNEETKLNGVEEERDEMMSLMEKGSWQRQIGG